MQTLCWLYVFLWFHVLYWALNDTIPCSAFISGKLMTRVIRSSLGDDKMPMMVIAYIGI